MGTLNGGQILVRALQQHGIDTMFDIPGDPMGAIMGAGRAAGMNFYSVRHEQTAAMAAQAYGFVGRRMGVAMVASGPAMTNAITGLATAQANRWPMLLIAGASESGKRGLGDFQEMAQREAAAPFCKLSITMDDPRRIEWFVGRGIWQAMTGAPGPVYLDFPSDVINAEIDEDEVEPYTPQLELPRVAADPDAIRRAAAALAKAERPLLILGEGAAWADATDEARELVDQLQIPFVPSPMGKGIVSDDHPLCFSGARSYALRNADTIVLAGARFNWIFHFGRAPRFAPGVKLIHIDDDPGEIGKSIPASVGLVGDTQTIFKQLSDEVGTTAPKRFESAWVQSLEQERQKNADAIAPMVNSDAPLTNLYRMFRDLNEALPPDAILVDDGESTMAVSRVMQSLDMPRHRLDAGATGCMGVGVPYAIGAQVAAPGTPVVSINGDYAFGWNGIEIETAIRYKLPILFVVANNGSVRGVPRVFDMADYTGEDAIRYDRMMEAFGGYSEHVTTQAELKPAIERALASGRTSLVNVVIDPNANRKPQAFAWLDRLGKMRYAKD